MQKFYSVLQNPLCFLTASDLTSLLILQFFNALGIGFPNYLMSIYSFFWVLYSSINLWPNCNSTCHHSQNLSIYFLPACILLSVNVLNILIINWFSNPLYILYWCGPNFNYPLTFSFSSMSVSLKKSHGKIVNLCNYVKYTIVSAFSSCMSGEVYNYSL